MDPVERLRFWVLANIPEHVAMTDELALSAIDGDAGFRRYFRTNTVPPLMAVHAPPEHENVVAFVSKDLAFLRGGVHVPTVYAVDYRDGFMLQEDLGTQLLLPCLNLDTMGELYGCAEAELVRIQQLKPEAGVFAPYDHDQLMREMSLFPEWFVEQLLGLPLNVEEEAMLTETFTHLSASAQEQPQVVVHRDYHSRNLLISNAKSLGVIDFQDALVGAFTYDLVSLLKDCYIRWPASVVRARALPFLAARMQDRGLSPASDEQLMSWFDLMGLQRHIKVLGIFARLWLRDGKARYLSDLPLVLRYTLEVTGSYPELERFNQWLRQRVLPAAITQQWYRDWQTAGEPL